MTTEIKEIKTILTSEKYIDFLVSCVLKRNEKDVEGRQRVLNLICDAVNAISSMKNFNAHEVKNNIEAYKNIISTSITLNMTLNPYLGLATIMKFKESPSLLITYKGLLNIINQDPRFEKISADVIYKNERYEVLKGTEEKFVHYPEYIEGGRALNDRTTSFDLIIGAYAVLKTKTEKYFEVMSRAQINQVRETSSNYRFSKNSNYSCIWNDWYDEMAKKTALRRLMKYIIVGNDNEQLTKIYSTALAVDNAQHENKIIVVNDQGDIETKDRDNANNVSISSIEDKDEKDFNNN